MAEESGDQEPEYNERHKHAGAKPIKLETASFYNDQLYDLYDHMLNDYVEVYMQRTLCAIRTMPKTKKIEKHKTS